MLVKQVFLGYVILFFTLTCLGQKKTEQSFNERYWGIPKTPLNCEMNDAYLSQVKEIIREQHLSRKFLILIARLGIGESRRSLNERRLHNVSFKLSNDYAISKEKIILTQGTPIKGLGRVEIYLNGEMVGALLVSKNRDICVSCCGPNDYYYPYKIR